MLNVLYRDLNEKTRVIRERGYIPAVIFGNKLDNSIPIELYKTDFKRLIEAGDNTNHIDLNLNGEVKTCVITNVDIEPIKEVVLHIDFRLL
ncbi:MAG: hypothetical protein ACRC3Y_06730 [Romboutsia sp.]|uniref:hypothetical protein n=1 Tax=Romboutsia sp. TaxID=1965302 RepID=UPI003F35D23E